MHRSHLYHHRSENQKKGSREKSTTQGIGGRSANEVTLARQMVPDPYNTIPEGDEAVYDELLGTIKEHMHRDRNSAGRLHEWGLKGDERFGHAPLWSWLPFV